MRSVPSIGAPALVLALLASTPAAAQNYVGPERCRTCHEFEFQVWDRSAHRRAQLALSDEQRSDAKCNTCHTMKAETGNADTAVTCERCHGPGRYYHPEYVMRDHELARAVFLVDPKPEHCQQCHTEGTPSIRPFKYDEMWAKIDHGPVARAVWEQARLAASAAPKPKAPAKPPAAKPTGKAP